MGAAVMGVAAREVDMTGAITGGGGASWVWVSVSSTALQV